MSAGSDESCPVLASCREIPSSPSCRENNGRKQQRSVRSKYPHVAVRNSQKSAELSLTSIPWQMYTGQQSPVYEGGPWVTHWLSHTFQWVWVGRKAHESLALYVHRLSALTQPLSGGAVPRCLAWQGCPFRRERLWELVPLQKIGYIN